MSGGIVVLKFGGSVLRSSDDIALAVHEIYRWLSKGHQMIAVVSAIGNRTNELLDQAARFGSGSQDRTRSLLVSTGELQSAAMLGMALDQSGVPNQVLTAGQIGLTTCGDPLDAMPDEVNIHFVQQQLTATPVLVVPGFVGQDAGGQTTLFGRGGSDLTAIFLAQKLAAARCRLIKDVDGLYEYDPKLPGPRPSRFCTLSWESALRLDETIVQHKAIEFARQQSQDVEVASFNSRRPTLITDVQRDTFVDGSAIDEPLRVGLIGFGAVGKGVFERLRRLPRHYFVAAIAVRNPERAASRGAPRALLCTGFDDLIHNRRCDVIVEAMGGVGEADRAIRKALDSGIHVITANKSVVACHGLAFRELACQRGVTFTYSASVGGGVPVIETIRRARQDGPVRELSGLLNGTANFVLEQIRAGETLNSAVLFAKGAGLAESDPSRDLNGIDAAEKLVILARELGSDLQLDQVSRQVIDPEMVEKIKRSGEAVPKQVARLRFSDDTATAEVSIEFLQPDHPWSQISGAGNAIRVESSDDETVTLTGLGAGRWPTAESVLGDLLCLSRNRAVVAESGSKVLV